MCATYLPVRETTRIVYPAHHLFDIDRIVWTADGDVYPTGRAPIIRLGADGQPQVRLAMFGMLPVFAESPSYGKKFSTYNSRSETSGELRTFKPAFAAAQRCIIPATWFYEPKYNDEGTKSTRWRIWRADGGQVGIAGLWSWWPGPQKGRGHGQGFLTMTMLTVNAQAHPLMRQMHRPDDEKRSVVVLDEGDYDQWLRAPMAEAWELVRLPADDALAGEPAPVAYKTATPAKAAKPPAQEGLF